jgi:long-subunit fatty acid transport protein
MTARGRALELGLSVRYRLAPNLSVYGGWRLSDAGGEAEEFYGSGSAHAANVGLRLRF